MVEINTEVHSVPEIELKSEYGFVINFGLTIARTINFEYRTHCKLAVEFEVRRKFKPKS